MSETRHGSPTFYNLLEKMAETHDSKSHDYASNDNPSGNYHFAGMLSKLFDNPDDAGFIGRIGEKLYRLANLENSGKVVKNESIEDTELDICVITALWISDRKDRRIKKQIDNNFKIPIHTQEAETKLWDKVDESADLIYLKKRLQELEAYIVRLNKNIQELTESNFKLSERLNDYESRGIARQKSTPISRLKQSRRSIRRK